MHKSLVWWPEMSKRYGRSQKRAHRVIISKLAARLARESTAHMYLPEDGVPELTDLARVIEYSVCEDGGVDYMVNRTANVTVVAIEDIYHLIMEQTVVQFMGTRYIIGNADYDVRTRFETYGGPSHCRLELVGVAS